MKDARQEADELLEQFSHRLKQYTAKDNITVDDCDDFMADVGKFGIAITSLLKDLGFSNGQINDFKSEHLDDLLRSSDVSYDKVVNDPRFRNLFFGEKIRPGSHKLLTTLTSLVLGSSLLTNVLLYNRLPQETIGKTRTEYKTVYLNPFQSRLFDTVYRLSSKQIRRRPFVSRGDWNQQVKSYANFLFDKPQEKDLEIVDKILRNYVKNRLKGEESEQSLDEVIDSYGGETLTANYVFDQRSDWTTYMKHMEVQRLKEKLEDYLDTEGELKLRGHWRTAVWKFSEKFYDDYYLDANKRLEVTDLLLRELHGSYQHEKITMVPATIWLGQGFVIKYSGGKQ